MKRLLLPAVVSIELELSPPKPKTSPYQYENSAFMATNGQ